MGTVSLKFEYDLNLLIPKIKYCNLIRSRVQKLSSRHPNDHGQKTAHTPYRCFKTVCLLLRFMPFSENDFHWSQARYFLIKHTRLFRKPFGKAALIKCSWSIVPIRSDVKQLLNLHQSTDLTIKLQFIYSIWFPVR